MWLLLPLLLLLLLLLLLVVFFISVDGMGVAMEEEGRREERGRGRRKEARGKKEGGREEGEREGGGRNIPYLLRDTSEDILVEIGSFRVNQTLPVVIESM